MKSQEQRSSYTNVEYKVPSSDVISRAQNEVSSLRLLLAQRKLYSRGKRWLAIRLWGMGFIAIIAPVMAFIWPASSVVLGAIAGAWLFLGRTGFLFLQREETIKAAAVQELFDLSVFKMPKLANRPSTPRLEEISSLAGPDADIMKSAEREKLLDWYPVLAEDSGITSIAICQRANASYSTSLLNAASRTWLGIIAGWTMLLIILSFGLKLALSTFLLAVFLPLLPAFLDTVEFWRGFREASSERGSLTEEIEGRLAVGDIAGEDLIVWQTRLYDMRRDMPQIPDVLYKLERKNNERNMLSAARQLSDATREGKDD